MPLAVVWKEKQNRGKVVMNTKLKMDVHVHVNWNISLQPGSSWKASIILLLLGLYLMEYRLQKNLDNER